MCRNCGEYQLICRNPVEKCEVLDVHMPCATGGTLRIGHYYRCCVALE